MGDLSDTPKRLGFFERNLSLWVLLCMVGGLGLGKLLPDFTTRRAHWEFGADSHVMLSVCRACNASRGWYQRPLTASANN